MNKLAQDSIAIVNDASAAAAVLLLANYSFDLGGYTAGALVEQWSSYYPINWVRLAVIEALYQGRYKAVSVEQILTIWARRNQPLYHFNCEFERLVCSKLPEYLIAQSITDSEAVLAAESQLQVNDRDIPVSSQTELTSTTVAAEMPLEELQDDMLKAIALAEPDISTCSDEERSPIIGEENETKAADSLLGHPPIHRFTPTRVFPDLHTKLKAIALDASPDRVRSENEYQEQAESSTTSE